MSVEPEARPAVPTAASSSQPDGPSGASGTGGPDSPDSVPLPGDRFLDRELSWLRFNQRVLELAEDPDVPLLERARFLAIFASNLDEFFMVRVAGLKRRMATGLAVRAASGLQPRQVLERVSEQARELMRRHSDDYRDVVHPALCDAGIEIVRWDDLGDEEQDSLHQLFRDRIFPVLTPLAVDPAHPFPYISGLSLNLAVIVRNPNTGTEHFARIKVPPVLPRFTRASAQRFVPLEDVISAHLQQLFPGMQVLQHHMFRVTRNEDLEVDEDEAENLLQALERELMRRRFGPPVRLEVEETIDPHLLDLLKGELGVGDDDVFALPGPLDLTGLHAIADLDRPELKFAPFVPGTHRDLVDVEAREASIFAKIRQGEILVQHPYDSFATSVQAFIEQAAADPGVLAIKQTLYRTSGDSPIVDALIDAAEAGKQVLVLVEIKARFDESANIKWARKLEQAGCHVVYGLVGLKTHCKAALVIREEKDGLRRYVHMGTGNYNPKTARLYEDFGLLTCDEEVGADLTNLFNTLSGFALGTGRYKRILVAPESMRSGIVERIEQQAAAARAGRPARVRIKVNSLVDEAVIDALYRASQAGVDVELWVRGICALRPGVPGLSDRIRVVSILGRFLEHSRLFQFGVGETCETWFGSADMMHRNLDRRIETLVRLVSPEHVAELDTLLDLGFDRGTAAWELDGEGVWTRRSQDDDGQPLRDLQDHLMTVKQRGARSARG
ncbi:RNA degradosome polyphosphate kinase [Motilibacter aurantiacus]|uniref:RNA degradosome polyphosphate kinase n=1 Tax=Motilibacter aurantiacus TaxID=2714955 RepID=UPI00140A0786|nr:RNA degradosome polyphosphate kinase [Motilibacter aurantiacus]NHC47222.1 RNA degradosome polyphosphate kinase [Motilibacter aurantiacus]